jgi:hypothetical protein
VSTAVAHITQDSHSSQQSVVGSTPPALPPPPRRLIISKDSKNDVIPAARVMTARRGFVTSEADVYGNGKGYVVNGHDGEGGLGQEQGMAFVRKRGGDVPREKEE